MNPASKLPANPSQQRALTQEGDPSIQYQNLLTSFEEAVLKMICDPAPSAEQAVGQLAKQMVELTNNPDGYITVTVAQLYNVFESCYQYLFDESTQQLYMADQYVCDLIVMATLSLLEHAFDENKAGPLDQFVALLIGAAGRYSQVCQDWPVKIGAIEKEFQRISGKSSGAMDLLRDPLGKLGALLSCVQQLRQEIVNMDSAISSFAGQIGILDSMALNLEKRGATGVEEALDTVTTLLRESSYDLADLKCQALAQHLDELWPQLDFDHCKRIVSFVHSQFLPLKAIPLAAPMFEKHLGAWIQVTASTVSPDLVENLLNDVLIDTMQGNYSDAQKKYTQLACAITALISLNDDVANVLIEETLTKLKTHVEEYKTSDDQKALSAMGPLCRVSVSEPTVTQQVSHQLSHQRSHQQLGHGEHFLFNMLSEPFLHHQGPVRVLSIPTSPGKVSSDVASALRQAVVQKVVRPGDEAQLKDAEFNRIGQSLQQAAIDIKNEQYEAANEVYRKASERIQALSPLTTAQLTALYNMIDGQRGLYSQWGEIGEMGLALLAEHFSTLGN